MRLLILTQYFWPEDFRINELVAHLVLRGHQVTVLTGRPNYPGGRVFPEFLANPAAYATYQGATVIRVPMLARGRGALRLLLNYLIFPLSATLIGLTRLRRADFDVVFVFEPSPVTIGLPAVAFQWVKRWPFVFWVLDQWPETLAAVGVVRSPFVLQQIGRLVSFIYSRAALMLVTSKSLVIGIRKYCRPDGPVAYFPNWVEAAYHESGTPAPEVPVQQGTFNVMFAGNIGESQNFPAILDAAEALAPRSNIRWLIVGDGRMADWVRAEIGRRGLEGRVVMLGRHPAERMPSFYVHASALLVSLKPDPAFALTIPGKLQSYLAFGLPILGMLDGDGAGVIDEARAGLTCPAGDARGLVAMVVEMAGMSDVERRAMGDRGRAFAAQEFDRDRLVSRLEEWLRAAAIRTS